MSRTRKLKGLAAAPLILKTLKGNPYLIFMLISTIKNKLYKSDDRSVKMRKNTLAMLLIRGLSIFISLLSAPIMLHHVNRTDYGVLMTLTSLVSWVGLMDIGLGNGLRNTIPIYRAEGNILKAKEAVSSCYAALALYVGCLIAIFIILSPFCDWIKILNSPNSNALEILGLANVVFIAFCLQFLFSLLNSVLFAYQMPAFSSVFGFIGQIVALIALIIQVYVFDVKSVFQIGSINCLVQPLVLFTASLFLYKGRLRDIAPSIRYVNLKSVNGILGLGLKFFVLQIITIILFQANSIIIAHAVGPESVVEYNLAFKYISVVTMFFNIAIAPIWSATTDAYVKKDYTWIKKTISYSKKICYLTITIGCVMFLLSKYVYKLWLGTGTITIPYTTTGLILLYTSFEMLYKIYGTIINGIGKVYAQMVITGIVAIVYIPLAYFLGCKFGLIGVLIANVIVFAINFIWSKTQCLMLINNTAKGIWNK